MLQWQWSAASSDAAGDNEKARDRDATQTNEKVDSVSMTKNGMSGTCSVCVEKVLGQTNNALETNSRLWEGIWRRK